MEGERRNPMEQLPQRWLSLDGICTTLNVSKDHALWLAKSGFLEVIWGSNKMRRYVDARFLDPTPAYAERLKIGEALYGRLFPIPHDLDLCGLLTIREVAEIMGWSLRYARKYAWKYKLPSVRAGRYDLYSPSVVRDLLWRRGGRRLSKQKAPFLVTEMIEWFLRSTAQVEADLPTDAQLAQDEVMQRKLARMMKLPSPDRERALAEFLEKTEMAKQLLAVLRDCRVPPEA